MNNETRSSKVMALTIDFTCFIDDDLLKIVTDYLAQAFLDYQNPEEFDPASIASECWLASCAGNRTTFDLNSEVIVDYDQEGYYKHLCDVGKNTIEWLLDENKQIFYDLFASLNITDVYCVGSNNYRASFIIESH